MRRGLGEGVHGVRRKTQQAHCACSSALVVTGSWVARKKNMWLSILLVNKDFRQAVESAK